MQQKSLDNLEQMQFWLDVGGESQDYNLFLTFNCCELDNKTLCT